MPARTLPGIGLTAGYSGGEDGWGPAMNTNLILLSALVQMTAVNAVDNLPVTPADGEIYVLLATAPSNPGMIAIRDDGLWRYVQPVVGWQCFVTAQNSIYRFVGGTWIPITSAASLPPFSAAVATYQLSVNPMGTGVVWLPPYEPTYEIPMFNASDIGKQLLVVPDTSPEADPPAKLAWEAQPISLPAITGTPAQSQGKVVVVNAAGTGVDYEEDGKYRAVSPGYVLTNADFSGRVILGATGNIVIPAGLTRTSTLTISRMSSSEVEIVPATGVTLNVADNRRSLRSRYSTVSLVRTAPDTYLMIGDVAV